MQIKTCECQSILAFVGFPFFQPTIISYKQAKKDARPKSGFGRNRQKRKLVEEAEVMFLYHGSTVIVEKPQIRAAKFYKDFSFGFYCTVMLTQAQRWATRFGDGFVNIYEYMENKKLKILRFPNMSEEWLDFIASCRSGSSHSYDIVEGPMADDAIYNYVQGFIDGKYTREMFWALARFKHPTHQISFHSDAALQTLKFVRGDRIHEKE